MAKKKETQLAYLQMPLPAAAKSYKLQKVTWHGLNMRQTIDTGVLAMEKNISTAEAPYLTPSKEPLEVYNHYEHPISVAGFDNFLVVVYREGSTVYVDYIKEGESHQCYRGELKTGVTDAEDEIPRCIVQFNVYDTPTDPITGKYVKKLLIFPDKASMDYEITGGFELGFLDATVKEYTPKNADDLPGSGADINAYYRNTTNNNVYRYVDYKTEDGERVQGWKISVPPGGPGIKYATVHLSRLFGVDDDRVYASGYNDYTNWNLDTADSYNESNAWCSPAQSNTKAGSAFTGITAFQNHVICFKRDFMHEIYNTKNPFRVQDIYAEGAIDHRTVQDVDGQLIFVSEDGVKVYTGADPRLLSFPLNLKKITYAVSGTDNRSYFLYVEEEGKSPGRLLTYDTVVGEWSERSVSQKLLGFAHNKNGMYALPSKGKILKLDTEDYAQEWSFETDLFTNKNIDIKHIRKIHMLADVGKDAKLKLYLLYDGEKFSDKMQPVYESSEEGRKTIRIRPRNAAGYGFKIHAEGSGFVRIYHMELQMNHGGEMYVTGETD